MAATPNYVWTNNWGWQPVGAQFYYGSLNIANGYSEGCDPCLVLAPGVCSFATFAGTC